MPSVTLPLGSLVVRGHETKSGELHAFYEAKWRYRGKQVKRRIGPAWLDPDGEGDWKKRRGRVVEGSFDERGAMARMAEVIAEYVEEQHKEPQKRDVTFDQASAAWLKHLSLAGRAKPSTLREYKILLAQPGPSPRGGEQRKARLMRAFGGRRLIDISTADVARFLNRLDEEELKPRQVNWHRQVLNSIFNYAMKPETFGLRENPVSPTEKRREAGPGAIDTFTPEDLAAIERAALGGSHREPLNPDHALRAETVLEWERFNQQDAALFMVAALTGLRQGELRALRWKSLDFAGGRILVEGAVSDGKVQTTTKGRKIRSVPMTDDAARRLEGLSKRGKYVGRDDFVFCGESGEILDDSALRRRFKSAQKAAKVRQRRFHDLRHTFGSMAVRVFSPVEVKEMMGHASLTTTERYLHVRPRADDAARLAKAFAADKVEEAFEVALSEG